MTENPPFEIALSEEAPLEKVPFTILTGFLGAGKTTALNRLLGARVPRRVAVLVNDLGRVNIDRQLIRARHGDILELSGGCVCCVVNVQRDLWAGILDLCERANPQQIILETTGIAEPHIILDKLRDEGGPSARVLPAGVVCVVDAEDGARTLRERSEARAQVEHAERILVSKLDLASAAAAQAAHDAVRALNDDGELASFPPGDEAATRALADWLLEVRPLRGTAARWLEPAADEDEEWAVVDLSRGRPARAGDGAQARRGEDGQGDDARADPHRERAAIMGGARRHPSAPHVHGQLEVVTFTDDAPLLAGPVLEVLGRLRDSLVRCKGFVHVAGEPRRGFVEKAGAQPLSLTFHAPWADARPRTELVLIGEGLDDHALHRQLWACRAGG